MHLLVIPFPAIDPVVFSFGIFELRWYSLAYIFGIILTYMLALRLVKMQTKRTNGKYHIKPIHLEGFAFSYSVIGVVVGGRLGYVLFYNLPYFLEHPAQIFAIWQGGMSFHGGIIGILVALIVYCYRQNINFFYLSDLLCCCVPIALFLGRIANFINGELYGRVTDVSWAFIFPGAGPEPRHPSQLYEAFLEGFLLLVTFQILVRKTYILNKAGCITGLFLIGYATARISVEFFREPDAHLGLIYGNLTVGMILSLPMLVAGIGIIIYALTTPSNKSYA